MRLKRKWTLYVINHSHTDVGYTERQERIERYQADYLKQALKIRDRDYKWTVENFWAVEMFHKYASKPEHALLRTAIKSGQIGLTAGYLNLTALAGYDLYRQMSARAVAYARTAGIELKEAMTADVNGLAAEYLEALADLGVTFVLSCLHTHHGMVPLWQKPAVVRYQTRSGKEVVLWQGEHYMLGNEFSLVPAAPKNYTIHDEFEQGDSSLYEGSNSQRSEIEIGKERILRYLELHEKNNFPFSLLPIPVAGLIIDNAPPNPQIAYRVKELNAQLGEQVEIKMATLKDFHEALPKDALENIPPVAGEWPDWWTDGAGSMPAALQLYRDTQRRLSMIKQLDPQNAICPKEEINKAEYYQMLYAEHTYGHSESIRDPGMFEGYEIYARKIGYAAKAAERVGRLRDRLFEESLGDSMLRPDRPLHYLVVNPFDFPINDIARLSLNYWEMKTLDSGFKILDEEGREYRTSDLNKKRHFSEGISVLVSLPPRGRKALKIIPMPAEKPSSIWNPTAGIEGIRDIAPMPHHPHEGGVEQFNYQIGNKITEITWTPERGITSWIDKKSDKELVFSKAEHGVFQPLYEMTPLYLQENNEAVRRNMGRNRKGPNVQRWIGKIVSVQIKRTTPLYDTLEFQYHLQGCHDFSVFINLYCQTQRADFLLRFTKETKLDPENLYLSLPFFDGEKGELWLHKERWSFRPWKDQIPGSLTDFYAVHDGIGCEYDDYGIGIATPDTPLIQVGSIYPGHRLLMGHPQLKPKNRQLYVWAMNNYWETNFNANLGGFYELRFVLLWGKELSQIEKNRQACRSACLEVPVMRLKD